MSSCPVCEKTDIQTLRETPDREQARRFSLVRCTECGLVYVEPPLSHAELSTYYPDEFYGSGSTTSTALVALFSALRAHIVQKVPVGGKKLLDVGCGSGDFLEAMQRRGWEVHGIEPSESGRSLARARGLDVSASAEELDAGPFDVVTMWQSAEHVRDLIEMLSDLRKRVGEGGALVVAVPNASSLEARLFKNRWFHLDVPRHQLHFSPSSLTITLERSGFSLEGWDSFSLEWQPFGLIQSVHNCLPIEHNALYWVVKRGKKLGQLPLLTRAVVASTLATLPVTAAVATAAEWALAKAQLGGTMTAIARPLPRRD